MKTISKPLAIVLLLLLLTTMISSADSGISVFVDQQQLQMEQGPIMDHQIILMPVRDVFQALGAEITWDEAAKQIVATKNNKIVKITLNSTTALVNNMPFTLDVPAQMINGKAMVPIHFIKDVFEAEIKWNVQDKTIDITSKEAKEEGKKSENPQGTLTYEESVKMAIDRSYKLRNTEATIKQEALKKERAEENIDKYPSGSAGGNAAFTGLVEQDIRYQMSKKEKEIQEDAIALSIKTKFNDILKQENKLELTQTQLEQAEAMKKIASARYAQGLISEYDMKQEEKDYQEKQESLKASVQSLNHSYEEFNELLGLSKEKRPKLAADISWEPLKDFDIERHITKIKNSSTSVWLAEQNVDLAQLNINLYQHDDISSTTYDVIKISKQKAQTDLLDTKQQLETKTRSIYNSMQQLETQYALYTTNLEKVTKTYELVKTQKEAGLAVPIDVLNASIAIEQIKTQMKEIELQYNTLILSLEKPWV